MSALGQLSYPLNDILHNTNVDRFLNRAILAHFTRLALLKEVVEIWVANDSFGCCWRQRFANDAEVALSLHLHVLLPIDGEHRTRHLAQGCLGIETQERMKPRMVELFRGGVQ